VRLLLRGRLVGTPQPLGARGDHLAMTVCALPDADGPMNAGVRTEVRAGIATGADRGVRVLAWNWSKHWADFANSVRPGAVVEMVVEPKLSRWKGNTRVEPVLADLRVLNADELASVANTGTYSVGTVANEPLRI
jgi:hypothetical protein